MLHRHYIIALSLLSGIVNAGEADVVNVELKALGENKFRVNATVAHADSGWDHYANRWDVLTPDGELLGSRELAHPHDNEQPFTRSLTVLIPADIKQITVRAHDSVHELGGTEFTVTVPH